MGSLKGAQLITLLLLIFILCLLPKCDADCHQDSLSLGFEPRIENDKYYLYNENNLDFISAWEFCRNKGSDLATVKSKRDSEALKAFYQKNANDDSEAWIGLMETSESGLVCQNQNCDNLLEWVDGSLLSDTASLEVEVRKMSIRGRCHIIKSDFILYDRICDLQLGAICQRSCDTAPQFRVGSPLAILNTAFRLHFNDPATFEIAKNVCRSEGGQLLEPRDGSKDLTAIKKIMNVLSKRRIWLGLERRDEISCLNAECHQNLTWVSDEKKMESSKLFRRIDIKAEGHKGIIGQFGEGQIFINAWNLRETDSKKAFICQISDYCSALPVTSPDLQLVEAEENFLRTFRRQQRKEEES